MHRMMIEANEPELDRLHSSVQNTIACSELDAAEASAVVFLSAAAACRNLCEPWEFASLLNAVIDPEEETVQ